MSGKEALSVGLSFPLSNPSSKYGPVLKGAGLAILSIFIVPAFTLFGYALRLREHTANGAEEAPTLDEWGDLTVEGLYGFGALIPLWIAFFVAAFGAGLLSGVHEALGMVAMIVVLLAGYYVIPAFISAYAVKRDFMEAYTCQEVQEVIKSRTYAIGYLKFIPLSIGLGIAVQIGYMLFLIPGLLLTPYVMYVRHSFWGAVYRNAREE